MLNEMVNAVVKLPNDHTLYRSGVFIGKEQIVVACGYKTDGKFGYFIINESKDEKIVTYGKQYAFIPKMHGKSYQEALNKLKEIVLAEKR